MADLYKVTLELDKPRTLCYDFNAMVAFEEVTGSSIVEVGINLKSAKEIRAILWAGMLHEDPDITVEDVGRMIHAGNIEEIGAKMRLALTSAMPKSAGNPEAVNSHR